MFSIPNNINNKPAECVAMYAVTPFPTNGPSPGQDPMPLYGVIPMPNPNPGPNPDPCPFPNPMNFIQMFMQMIMKIFEQMFGGLRF